MSEQQTKLNQPLTLAGEEFKEQVTAEYFHKGNISKKLQPLWKAIQEAQGIMEGVVLKQAKAVMLVVKAMRQVGVGMTQQEMAKIIGCDRSWISRTLSWYNNARKENAAVVKLTVNGKEKEFPVTDPDSFIRLLDAGVNRATLDANFKRQAGDNSPKSPKTAEMRVGEAIVRAMETAKKEGHSVSDLDKETATNLAAQIVTGNHSMEAIVDHAKQASEAVNPSERLDGWLALCEQIKAGFEKTPPGAFKKGQIHAAMDMAGELVSLFGDYIEQHGLERGKATQKEKEAA